MSKGSDGTLLLIRNLAVLSSVGVDTASWGAALQSDRAPTSSSEDLSVRVFKLHRDAQVLVDQVVSDERYARLDRTAHLAIAASRETVRLGSTVPVDVGLVSIGTSRGATTSLEESFEQFAHSCGRVPALTSPVTTAGALSSWVAQDLLFSKSREPGCVLPLTTSMTCTSALHSLITAKAFVESSMVEAALFGGSESSLTPFTQAQVEALRIGAKGGELSWPSRPCATDRPERCGLTLGEAAGTAWLVRVQQEYAQEADLALHGVGWGVEAISSPTGISDGGDCFEVAMRTALRDAGGVEGIDCVMLHAPGTVKGDTAEIRAVRRLLGDVPLRTSKHITGHTYGASGMVSLQLAQYLLHGGVWTPPPYPIGGGFECSGKVPTRILINAAGFGGNAISLIVGRAR